MRQGLYILFLLTAWLPRAAAQETLPPPAQPHDTSPETLAPPAQPHEAPAELHASAEEAEHAEEHCPPTRWWFRGEYLLWFIKSPSAPPLVSSGFAIESRPGALGVSSTKLLFGGENFPTTSRNGGRFLGGWWADDDHQLGVEGGYFFVGSRAVRYANSANGANGIALARPYFDALNNMQDSSLIAYPGVISGSISVTATTFFDGAELNGLSCICHGDHWRVAALAGFRYLNLEEDLRVEERDNVSLTSPQLAGSIIGVTDVFDTQNYFYGGQVGFKAEFEHKHFFLDLVAKVALGVSHQVVRAWGQTNINGANVADAGFLVLASNRGTFTNDAFAVVPELGVNLGYEITHNIRAFVGYTFLYWSDVLRPGDQVDFALNPNLIPTSATFGAAGGPARPTMPLRSADFWTQGISFGMEFRY